RRRRARVRQPVQEVVGRGALASVHTSPRARLTTQIDAGLVPGFVPANSQLSSRFGCFAMAVAEPEELNRPTGRPTARDEAQPLGAGEPGLRVLVVDDEESITDLVATALRYEGFQVEVARTGRDALTAATSVRPHLIVL